mgnify:CR=1 FL=1
MHRRVMSDDKQRAETVRLDFDSVDNHLIGGAVEAVQKLGRRAYLNILQHRLLGLPGSLGRAAEHFIKTHAKAN